jgi:copper(I)-binding protein
MTLLRFAPLALVALASPAFAHQGMLHDGCPPGQTFTVGDITVTDAFSRAMLAQAKVGAGYMTIANAGTAPDRLVGATTEATDKVKLHNMTTENGMMKMSPVEGGVEVPAGGSVTLAPAGLHIMFVEPHAPFKQGECVAVTLKFEKAGDLPVQLVVGPVGADSAPMEMEHSGHAM